MNHAVRSLCVWTNTFLERACTGRPSPTLNMPCHKIVISLTKSLGLFILVYNSIYIHIYICLTFYHIQWYTIYCVRPFVWCVLPYKQLWWSYFMRYIYDKVYEHVNVRQKQHQMAQQTAYLNMRNTTTFNIIRWLLLLFWNCGAVEKAFVVLDFYEADRQMACFDKDKSAQLRQRGGYARQLNAIRGHLNDQFSVFVFGFGFGHK